MRRSRLRVLVLAGVLLVVVAPARPAPAAAKTYVYFDQREEEDVYTYPDGHLGTGTRGIVPPWDPNGQLCLFPGRSGRFVVGYNPTTPDQTETAGRLRPYKQPPTALAVWDKHGRFTGNTIYVPGPYAFNPGSHPVVGPRVGGDIPPDANGSFHTNSTFTGCAFDSKGVLFAADIGTAQGQFPPPDNGRIIEWFPPTYRSYCILLGPTAGGTGPHHVGGTGGLRDPAAATMAVDAHDNVLVALPFGDGFPPGRIAKLEHSTLPRSAKDCPAPSNAPRKPVDVSTFIAGQFLYQPIPVGIARDPECKCWAVSSVFGAPSIAWYDDNGLPLPPGPAGKGPVLGGGLLGTFNPFGLAFAPDGTLFFVDIHLRATQDGFGPQDGSGAVYRVSFSSGVASPPAPIATGLYYPVSVTTCTPGRVVCPTPSR